MARLCYQLWKKMCILCITFISTPIRYMARETNTHNFSYLCTLDTCVSWGYSDDDFPSHTGCTCSMTSHPQARTSPYADQAHFCHRADLVVKIVNAIMKDERGFCLFIFHGFKLLVWKRECLAVAQKNFLLCTGASGLRLPEKIKYDSLISIYFHKYEWYPHN